MKRCISCGITSGIKDSHKFCHACGGIQFENATNNKNQDLANRVKTLEKKVAALVVAIQERQIEKVFSCKTHDSEADVSKIIERLNLHLPSCDIPQEG